MEVYGGVLPQPVAHEEFNVIASSRLKSRAWESAVGEDSDSWSVSDWIDEGLRYLDGKVNGASVV